MTAHHAYIGIGSNLGDRLGNVQGAISALSEIGTPLAVSSTYRTRPWGKPDQPWFANAVALVETQLEPMEVLRMLQTFERRLGRVPGERWGPRVIDLDLLLYDDLTIDEPELTIPHRHLHERAFVLVPLAEIDERFNPMRDRLPATERESVHLMSPPSLSAVGERVRALAQFLADTDAVRVRIARPDEEIEIAFEQRHAEQSQRAAASQVNPPKVDTIKADLVGIFRLRRPTPSEGELLDSDRELGYIEALGIRTPVHSMGGGRIVAIATPDGAAVDYGQPLFLVTRG
jgi:2-amino-4-hydroxy-6-hydroxymethyldihydropteridine diphosphokinase